MRFRLREATLIGLQPFELLRSVWPQEHKPEDDNVDDRGTWYVHGKSSNWKFRVGVEWCQVAGNSTYGRVKLSKTLGDNV